MQRTVSDHFPITLESHHITWGPCPFRLNNASLNEKDFTKNFPTWWENTKIEWHPGYSFIQRLKILATRIKDWQKQKVLSYKLEKDSFTKEIEAIDKLEFQNLLTAPLHSKRIALKSGLHDIELKEAQIWRQKARQKWIKHGDENSTFFHKICSFKQRKNLIKVQAI